MRVSVDARQAYRANRRGIGRSLVNLIRALAVLRPTWELKLFHEVPAADDPFAGLANVVGQRVTIPASYRFDLWERVRLPAAAWAARSDVLFCPANTGPGFALTPLLLMILDMIPVDEAPDAQDTKDWLRKVKRAAKIARRVWVPSEHSRNRIATCIGLQTDRMTVVPLAADPVFDPSPNSDAIKSILAKYGLNPGRPFVFGFGAEDPRKNTRRLLEAWARLPSALRDRFDLLLVGINEPALSAFRQVAQELLPAGGWHLHGFAADADVPVLLAAAELLCYPSLNEGFGLPVLDAFRVGTAVLTSNVASLPEVTGDAAILVNPSDTASITDALARILSDDTQRAALAEAGREREKLFTWEKTAERVAELIEEVARGAKK